MNPEKGNGVDPSDAGPVVSFDEVDFAYPNGTKALSGVSFDVQRGSILGICGPSGCGKSSLLALLAGLRPPSAGRIRWTGEAQAAVPTHHELSMVFQKDTLLPWLTVEGNVGLFETFNRRGNKRRGGSEHGLADELIELAGLDAFRKAYPYRLSGGMRRRLAFITSMAAQPRVLLLDEPFSALDEPTRIAIHQDVLRIVRRLGTTVVLVTHDLAEAASLCDEVLILSNRPGTVAARHPVPFGPTRDVLELRKQPSFLQLYGTLWDELSSQIAATKAEVVR